MVTSLPSPNEVLQILHKAKEDALNDGLVTGLILETPAEQCVTQIIMPSIIKLNQIELNKVNSDTNEDDDEKEVENGAEITRNSTSDSEMEEIEKDLSQFSQLDDLHLKDYSNQNTINESSYIKVQLKNKCVTIRKSSLCWFFSEKYNKLSSDRLLRVRGTAETKTSTSFMIKTNKLVPKKSSEKKKQKKQFKTETSSEDTETSDEYMSESSENDEFDDNTSVDENLPADEIFINIEIEKYYAVYYDTAWYIGRIISLSGNTCKIKFLEKFLEKYSWPKKEDIQDIERKFIFHGPVELKGVYPFEISRHEMANINKRYKKLKSVSNI